MGRRARNLKENDLKFKLHLIKFSQSTSKKIVMQVISSIIVSFSFHFLAAALTMAFPACSGELL